MIGVLFVYLSGGAELLRWWNRLLIDPGYRIVLFNLFSVGLWVYVFKVFNHLVILCVH